MQDHELSVQHAGGERASDEQIDLLNVHSSEGKAGVAQNRYWHGELGSGDVARTAAEGARSRWVKVPGDAARFVQLNDAICPATGLVDRQEDRQDSEVDEIVEYSGAAHGDLKRLSCRAKQIQLCREGWLPTFGSGRQVGAICDLFDLKSRDTDEFSSDSCHQRKDDNIGLPRRPVKYDKFTCESL